jgi:hypothetical protein
VKNECRQKPAVERSSLLKPGEHVDLQIPGSFARQLAVTHALVRFAHIAAGNTFVRFQVATLPKRSYYPFG